MNFNINSCNIAVVGDLMVDEYIYGSTSRISPEAPVPIILEKNKEFRLGGAGNVVNNLISLKANVSLFSVVGKDESADILKNILDKKSLKNLHLIYEDSRVTTKKSRVIAAHQQVLRIDKENTKDISKNSQEKILNSLKKGNYDAIILSDYNKGVLTKSLCQEIIEFANKNKILLLVDPKGDDFSKYIGATLITPNKKEASIATAFNIDSKDDIKRVLDYFKDSLNIKYPLITLSEDGIAYLDKELKIAPTIAKEVFDVTGAGDTVIAALSVALCSGAKISQACEFANSAAAVVVGKLGSATASIEEINSLKTPPIDNKIKTKDEISQIVKELKKENKKIVFTNGCFDILHRGHISYLQKAKELGDILIVGLNSDESVKRLKGNSRPINSFEDRAYMLAALSSTDYIVGFSEDTPYNLIKAVKPDILVKGADYKDKEVIGSDIAKEVKLIDFIDGKSTTNIIKKIKGS